MLILSHEALKQAIIADRGGPTLSLYHEHQTCNQRMRLVILCVPN